MCISRLWPDPTVTYSYPHLTISLTLVNISELFLLLGLPLFLILVPDLLPDKQMGRSLIYTLAAIGLLYALVTICAQPLGLGSQEVLLGNQRPQIFGAISSGLGNLLVLFTCLCLGQALYAQGQARFLWWIGSAICALGTVLSFGRASWLALALACLLILGLRVRKRRLLLIPILLVALGLPGILAFFDPHKIYGADRLVIWNDALTIWQLHPLIGIGAGNYQFFDLAYGSDIVGVAHNQYLEVLAEMGLIGLLSLLWLLIALGQRLYWIYRHTTDSEAHALALSSLGSYAAILLGGFFTDSLLPSTAAAGGAGPFLLASYRWLLIGLTLAIPHWNLKE